MAMVEVTCERCGATTAKRTGCVNRSRRAGAPIFCGRDCAGLARRDPNPPTPEEKKARKAAYDREYREKNHDRLKAEKAAWYQANRDPEKERAHRQANMHRHVEYCRQPAYKKKKAAYDLVRRDQMTYGEFADVAPVLRALEEEVASRATETDLAVMKGTLNKSQQRRRRYEQERSADSR